MDLSFGVDEDSAEKKYETSEREDGGCQKLQVELHNVGIWNRPNLVDIYGLAGRDLTKSDANMYTFLAFLQIFGLKKSRIIDLP